MDLNFSPPCDDAKLETRTKLKYLILAASAIEAGIRRAVVDIRLAEASNESFSAFAFELVVQVEALRGSGGVAKVSGALVDGGLAVEASVARSTVTDVAKVAV